MSTVNLGCKLDLKKIALHARNAEYNPKVGEKIFRIFFTNCVLTTTVHNQIVNAYYIQ